jgi:8-oxo-dGTP pyrophosphatase MutT (NUDIX family)
MRYEKVVAQLERALERELPGPSAHAALAPGPRRQWPAGFNPARIRNAAGLLLVFPATPATRARTQSRTGVGPEWDQSRTGVGPETETETAHIVVTVRADTLGRHGGQVSLPGGVVDPGETFEQAALREAHEEIALSIGGVSVLGGLTPLDIPVSGFRLHPIVATTARRPSMTPADGEVAAILELDLDELADPAALVRLSRTRDGETQIVPGFHVAGIEIWGATAMVLAEFLTLLGWTPRSPA